VSDSVNADFLNRLLCETREELTRVDGKVSVLLTGAVTLEAVVVAIGVAGGNRISSLPNSYEWIAWLGVVLLITGTSFLATALWPKVTAGSRSIPHYFSDFAKFDSAELLSEALSKVDPSERDASQLKVISSLLVAKYKRLRSALRFLAVGGACLALVTFLRQIGG
jgi:Family of unknown function (DUF5706)